MINNTKTKQFDLEDRTLEYARQIREYVKKLPNNTYNQEYARQMIRSSGSVGANYIEANESLGKKDFTWHIKICRKEAKETRHWLNLAEPLAVLENNRVKLLDESTELIKIFTAIIAKTTGNC